MNKTRLFENEIWDEKARKVANEFDKVCEEFVEKHQSINVRDLHYVMINCIQGATLRQLALEKKRK